MDLEYLEENGGLPDEGSQDESSSDEGEGAEPDDSDGHPDSGNERLDDDSDNKHPHNDSESERLSQILDELSSSPRRRNPSTPERDAIARDHARREHERRSLERSRSPDGNKSDSSEPSEDPSEEYNEVSKYFAGMAKAKKRSRDDSEEEYEISEMSSTTDNEGAKAKKKKKEKKPPRELGPTKQYFADESKYNRYFVQGAKCDRNVVGVPYTKCKKANRACTDQTENTRRRYIRPKSEGDKGRLEAQPIKEKYDFYVRNRRQCAQTPGEAKCSTCKSLRVRCHPAKPETIKAALRKKQKRKEKTIKKHEKKCYRYTRTELTYNGQRPYNNCTSTTNTALYISCEEWDEYNKSAQPRKCVYYELHGRACDRQIPCLGCKERGDARCYYESENSLVKKGVGSSAIKDSVALTPSVEYKEVPDDMCNRCVERKLNCDGGRPYYNCVTRRQKKLDETIIYYTYEDENHLRLRFTAQTHEYNTGTDGEGPAVVLRPD